MRCAGMSTVCENSLASVAHLLPKFGNMPKRLSRQKQGSLGRSRMPRIASPPARCSGSRVPLTRIAGQARVSKPREQYECFCFIRCVPIRGIREGLAGLKPEALKLQGKRELQCGISLAVRDSSRCRSSSAPSWRKIRRASLSRTRALAWLPSALANTAWATEERPCSS